MRVATLAWLGVAALSVAVAASGVWVVATKHEARRLFVELEELKREKDRLEVDWGRLRIEQSSYATHPRIETLARERLTLGAPRDDQVVVIAGGER